MRKARPLLALTCLLDLLFVMVFVALLLEEPQKLKDLETLTEALQIKVSQLEQEKSQMQEEMSKATSQLSQTQSELKQVQQKLKEEISKTENLKRTTLISKGVWQQYIRVNGVWKDGGTSFRFLDSQGKCHSAVLSFDSTWRQVLENKTEFPCDDQLEVWEWDVHSRTSGNGKFSLTRQNDGSYYGWLYFNGQRGEENRWVKIQDNLPLKENNR